MASSDSLGDGDSAFLGELLALIDGDDEAEQAATASAVSYAQGQQKSPHKSTKAPTGRKREIGLLREQTQQLTEQLTRLRHSQAHVESHTRAKMTALTERRKRQRAEDERATLRNAVFYQKQFLRGLRSVFSVSPRFSLSLDLCRYLHRDTRLSRSRLSRWDTFDSQAHNTRFASAVDVLCRETAAMSLHEDDDSDAAGVGTAHAAPSTTPFVHCELINEANSRSTTYTGVYALNTQDIAAVVRAVCVAIRDVVTICPSGHPLRVSRDVVDADAPSDHNLLYRVMRIGHQCASSGEEIQVASHIVTSYKITSDYGVVLWDFVDVDELHPASATINVTRETTGACLIRRERCDDGVERVVFRSLGTKKFRFHNQQSVEKHRRISCIVQADAMVRGDELLFRRLVLDQLAAEQAMEMQVAYV